MSAQHTPGPWTLFHHKDSGARYIDAGPVQMQITRTSDAGALQIDANARLIATAPELLARAVIDVKAMEEVANSINSVAPEAASILRTCALNTRAALAKAQEGAAS